MSLDRAREAAVEAGYIRDIGQTETGAGESTSTISDLLELLDEEARGRRQYREGVGAPSREADPTEIARDRHESEQVTAEFDAGMKEVEIDPASIDPALRARAIEIMNREGETDPTIAFDQAVMEKHVDEAEAGEFERFPTQIPGWDEHPDAGRASHGGGAPAGAAEREGEGAGAAARAGGESAGEARGETSQKASTGQP
jgi:hypothetical protein